MTQWRGLGRKELRHVTSLESSVLGPWYSGAVLDEKGGFDVRLPGGVNA